MKVSILQPQLIQELGKRTNQEDSIYPVLGGATSEDCLFVLCDGMGGHDQGEVASQLVCDVLPAYIKTHWSGGIFTDELLQRALDEVYRCINEYESQSIRKMGTTLTFICIHQGGVLMAHIGDSRIYHVRPSEHRILYKSRDHSLAYDLYLAGEISLSEVDTYKSNVITRAIMPGQEKPFKADIAHTTNIGVGDYFLLCTDGLLENIDDRRMVQLLCSEASASDKCKQLIDITKNNRDNHSAILIQVDTVEREDADELQPNDESAAGSNAVIVERIAERPNGFIPLPFYEINPKIKILKAIIVVTILTVLIFLFKFIYG